MVEYIKNIIHDYVISVFNWAFNDSLVSRNTVVKLAIDRYNHSKNSSWEKYGKNSYVVEYELKGKKYKTVVTKKRGPKVIISVKDDSNREHINTISIYMGPNEDFHGITYTPRFLGHYCLIFYTSDGNNYTFYEDDPIALPHL